MNSSTRTRILFGAAVVALIFAACGEDKDPHRFDGSAAMAVAQYWVQEAAGGKLPEGVKVAERGTQGVVTLDLTDEQKDAGARARVCVEYRYLHGEPPFDVPVRVYIATLNDDDEWAVEAVNPDGTCEGVV